MKRIQTLLLIFIAAQIGLGVHAIVQHSIVAAPYFGLAALGWIVADLVGKINE